MNLWLPALAAAGFLVFVNKKPSGGEIPGKTYVATYAPPEGSPVTAEVLGHLQSILPKGSLVSVQNGNLLVRFTAVSSAPVTDIQTPVGVFKLLNLQEV